jgi:hypothetical protein
VTITYLKKAIKTPQTGTDETRKIVTDMLAKLSVKAKPQRSLMGEIWMVMRGRLLSPPR